MSLLSTLMGVMGCGRKQVQPEPPTWANDARQLRTEKELTNHGIPINRWLPLVESEKTARIRTPQDVAKRAVVLHAITSVGHGEDRLAVRRWLESAGLWEAVTPGEKQLFGDAAPPQQAIVNAAWRAEALWVLLWTLGKVEKLDLPTRQCDPNHVATMMPGKGEVAQFIRAATLRPKSQILDETDRIYRIHWAVRDAQINGQPIPGHLSPDVVTERHYALNWLTWYADDWDEITTDT